MCFKKAFANPCLSLVALVLLLAALFGIGLGDRPYSAPSESRYVEIGREMAESGDYVTPRLDYVKYFEKPALFYWVQALTTKYLGLSPFVARIPTAFFAICLCLLTYALATMLYGTLAGWLGTLMLATSLYVFALSRVVLVDMPVSVFIAATLVAFLYVVQAPDGCRRTLVTYLMYVASACAVLSKGLIGAVLPGVVVFIWLACTGKWKVLKEVRLVSGLALFLLIAVPWHVLVAMRNPEWAHFYFIHEHFERYLTKEHGRYQPDWFFAMVLLAGLFPWICFACQSVCTGLRGFWENRRQDGAQLFLFIWMVFIFVFFSLSDSKLIPYILPIMPAIGALFGRYLAASWQKTECGFTTGFVVMMLMLLAIATASSLFPIIFDAQSKVMEAVKQSEGDIFNMSVAAMIAMVVLFVAYIQGQRKHFIIAMILVAAVLMQAGDKIAGHYNKDSMQNIAGVIQSLNKPGDEVVLYNEYYQDLPVYLKRRVTLVSWEKTELNFGATHEDTSAWMIDDKEFWKRWMKGDHLMFAVMREDAYKWVALNKNPDAFHLNLVFQDGRNMLFMNKPLPEAKKK